MVKSMSKEIDDIFSDKMEDKIKSEVRKKRKRSNIKLVAIGIILTLSIFIISNLGLSVVSNKYIENSYSKDREIKQLEYSIMYPDEYIGQERCISTGYFEYESIYDIGKRIGNKVLFAGSSSNAKSIVKSIMEKKFEASADKLSWTISRNPLNDDISKRYNNVYGMRKLHFLYPYVHYGKNIYEYQTEDNKISKSDLSTGKECIINDFHYLNELDDNKVVEMALSFDKGYTYEEINRMFDKDLITFYWVDSNSEEEKQHMIEDDNPAFNVVGIKSIDGVGEFRDDVSGRMENFKAALKQLKEMGHDQYTEYIDENNIKIIGAVVVGSPKELKAIQNNSMIKHAIMGTVVDKY